MFVQRGRVEFAAAGLGLLLAFGSTPASAQDATPATSDPPIAAPVDTPPAAPRQPAAETPAPAAIEPATSAAPAPAASPAPGSAVPASAPAAPTTQNGPAAPPAVPEAAAQDLPSAEGSGLDITPHGEVGRETLPHDLSPWGMFLAADIVVKAVMIGLALASLITWTVWISKSIELWFATRRLRRDLSAMRNATSLADAEAHLGRGTGVAARLVAEARDEHGLARNAGSEGGLEARIASRLDGVVSAAGRDMSRGTGVLASIGSTAPFVGLFGTVWGIMNSFIGISKSQTTNLAVVAPGIAEALLATAIGLVAAIPAVIIYNRFARAISGYKAQVADAAAEVRRVVSREHDRIAGRGAHHNVPPAAEAAE